MADYFIASCARADGGFDRYLRSGGPWVYVNTVYSQVAAQTTATTAVAPLDATACGAPGGATCIGGGGSLSTGPSTSSTATGGDCAQGFSCGYATVGGGNHDNNVATLAESIGRHLGGGSSSGGTTTAGSNNAACMDLNSSATDFDHDGNTGVTELEEHCSGR